MNASPTPPPLDPHDWQEQERRLAAPSRRADMLLARALAELPASQPPAGFAAGVARLAAQPAMQGDDASLERRLQTLLFAGLLLAAAISGVVWGGAIGTAMLALLGAGTSQWLLMGLACIALAAAPDLARRLRASPPPLAG